MPLPSPYRNPGRWRAVVFQQEVRHGTAGCLLSLVLLAPVLVPSCGVGPVVSAVLLYSLVLVPAITRYYSPFALLLRGSRLLLHGAALHELGRCMMLGSVGVAAQTVWALLCGVQTLWCGLRALLWGLLCGLRALLWGLLCGLRALLWGLGAGMWLVVTQPFSLLLWLHQLFLDLEGVRITVTQVVFFVMVQELLAPHAPLTSLYFLLFYTILLYIHRALFDRQWARLVPQSTPQDVPRLAAWYMAARLGKGVAMSFVLVMFTLQFSHVAHDPAYVALTAAFFVATQLRWTGTEWWARLLVTEEEARFWVPAAASGAALMASCLATAALALHRPALTALAAYTNVVVPGLLLWGAGGQRSPEAALALSCRRAMPKEVEAGARCPVCLEALEAREARVTPCHHMYHPSCLAACLAHSPLCPLCKQVI